MKKIKSEPKKGNASWKPSGTRLDVRNKKEGYRYRWVRSRDDQPNVDKKLEEGWSPVNKTTGAPVEHDVALGVQDGKPMGDVTTYRESILMAMPEETAKARDRYFQDQTDKSERVIKRTLEEELTKKDPRARTHGKIVIE